MNPGSHLDLIEKDRRVFALSYGAGPVSRISRNLISLHNIRKLTEDPAELLHPGRTELSGGIALRSHIDPVAYMVDLPHALCL